MACHRFGRAEKAAYYVSCVLEERGYWPSQSGSKLPHSKGAASPKCRHSNQPSSSRSAPHAEHEEYFTGWRNWPIDVTMYWWFAQPDR